MCVRAAFHSMHRGQDSYGQHMQTAPFRTACCTARSEYICQVCVVIPRQVHLLLAAKRLSACLFP